MQIVFTAECKNWFSSLDNRDCLAEVLSGNNWASQEELEAGDLRGRLEEQLSRFSRIGNACFSDCQELEEK